MLTPFQSAKLSYLFNLLDLNGNNILQLNDFAELAESVRKKLDYEEAGKEHTAIAQKSVKFFHKLLKDIPNPGYQVINREEWLDFFSKNLVSKGDEDTVDEWVDLLLAFLFGMFDENHDGYISISEYQDIFAIYGMDESFSKQAFDKIDVNGDGKLSRYELIPAIETFLISDNPQEPGNWVFGNWEK
ncbi:MAG: EF-hand domain-containing protein [Cyclobacteriaceae bacterium]